MYPDSGMASDSEVAAESHSTRRPRWWRRIRPDPAQIYHLRTSSGVICQRDTSGARRCGLGRESDIDDAGGLRGEGCTAVIGLEEFVGPRREVGAGYDGGQR